MNLVFMNSLERKVEEDRIETAQVLIQENQGVWKVLWHEISDQGKLQESDWFEGRSWDEMLRVFRYRLAEKMALGYTPLLSSLFDSEENDSDRTKLRYMLQYYSELHENDQVYQKLRQWRSEKASKSGMTLYLVASNKVLQMISTFLPHTKEELLQIPGLGEKKVEMYGDELIKLTADEKQSRNFPLDWVVELVDQQQLKQWMYKQKEMRYKQEIEKHEQRKKLLEGIQKGLNLEKLEALCSLSKKDLVSWVEQLDQEGYDLDVLIEKELSEVPHEVLSLAQRAITELGDRYLKPILQKVYSEDQIKELDFEGTYAWIRLLRIRHRKQNAQKNENIAS